MYDNIGQKIAALRKEKGLSQRELAGLLTELGEAVSDKAVSKWEKGATLPSARQFLLCCRALGLEDISGEFMGRGLSRGLNAAGRRKLEEYALLLRRSGLYEEKTTESGRLIRLYTLAVSAGPGQFQDDDDFELVYDSHAPGEADFAVRVAGDSMEPRFHDGQVVYVRRQDSLSEGQIGLFSWEGSAYIKQLRLGAEGLALHSLNRAYADIPIPEPQALRVFGRIL